MNANYQDLKKKKTKLLPVYISENLRPD